MEPLEYRAAGVDIEAGDRASALAFAHARGTFGFREGRPGTALKLDGVFTGLVDVGPFYLAMNSDGVGSKSMVARAVGDLSTLGFDLVAMVADDCVCAGAEPVALVNTLDTERVSAEEVDALMGGLEEACRVARVSCVGGEIAELRDQIRDFSWGAALTGLLARDRVLGPHRVRAGQAVVGLLTDNFRSNGYTLLRRILEARFGPEWVRAPFGDQTWGSIALAPSRIFTPLVVDLHGGLEGTPRAEVAAIAHITGGGLEGNTRRVLPPTLAVRWHDLPPPPAPVAWLIDEGLVSADEARRVWNMGVGMTVVTATPARVLEVAREHGVDARVVGEIQSSS
jgi:phosphoribosylformylglycinamidine cyclo-ligase